MGSSKKGNSSGGTKRGGKRPAKVAQSVDAGEEQPPLNHDRSSKQQQSKGSNSKKKKRYVSMNEDSDDEDVQLRRYLQQEGLESLEMNADGNCLFRSLSDQISGDYGKNHAIIRDCVCKFMEENKGDYEVFLVYEDEDDHEQQDEDAKDFEHYMEQMREDGEWGGHLELTAAARLFQRSIRVYQPNKTFYTIPYGGPKAKGNDMMVSFHDENHYNSVRDPKKPPDPNYLKERLAQMAAAAAGDDSDTDDDNSSSRGTSSTSREDRGSLDPPGEHARQSQRRVADSSIAKEMQMMSLGDNGVSTKSKRGVRREKKQTKRGQRDKVGAAESDDKGSKQEDDAPRRGRGFHEIRI